MFVLLDTYVDTFTLTLVLLASIELGGHFPSDKEFEEKKG